MNIDEIFKEDGILKRKNINYKTRPSQIKGAALIENALKEKKHFILEGPCGFGKSMAYLIPSIKNLIENDYNGKIVIVTSNISLQEQLMEKDIPFILDVFDELYPRMNVKKYLEPSVLKGISNFLCIDKLEDEDFLSKETLVNRKQFEKVNSFYNKTSDGDLTRSNIVLSNDMKNISTVTSEECKSSMCNYLNKCFYIKHKKKARAANIIVTNYHMLFYSINAINSVFKGSALFVFDEAHEIENILREFKAEYINNNKIEYIDKKIKEIKNKLNGVCDTLNKIEIEKLKEYSKEYFESLEHLYNNYNDKYKIIHNQKELPDSDNLVFILNNTNEHLKNVIRQVEKMLGSMNNDNRIAENSIENTLYNTYKAVISTIESLIRTCSRIKNIISNVDKILLNDNIVMWIEKENGKVFLGYKNIDVSDAFKNYFLDTKENEMEKTCIFTSATLSVGGNFEYLKNNLGLNKIEEDKIEQYIGQSPFNLEKQELWYLPKDSLQGNHNYFDYIIPDQIEKIINATNGGALCLFTSVKNMNYCKEELYNRDIKNTVFTQGEKSKRDLVKLFSEDKNSSLLATKSFFTGVDIPGETLRCIIIDKLPFSSPNDPVNQKLKEKENYFETYIIPEMIITLKQAIGRGVRTINDKCIICILDNRIETALYNKKIFSSFKYVSRISKSLEDVKDFLGSENILLKKEYEVIQGRKNTYFLHDYSYNKLNKNSHRKKIPKHDKGFTNIFVLFNRKTNHKYIGTNQLKLDEDILNKLFKLAYDERRDSYDTDLYKHLRSYDKANFIIKVVKSNIKIDLITEEYKLDLIRNTFINFKFSDLLCSRQKLKFKEVLEIQESSVDFVDISKGIL